MAAPASASRSAARSRACSAASCRSGRSPAKGSTFTLFVPLEARRGRRAGRSATTARYENSGAAVPTALPADARGQRRPRQSRRRSVRADRRGRRRPSPRSCSISPARPASRAWSRPPASGTLALARKLQPDAITLDLGLDDINGFVLLDLLKHDAETGDIPIHVISGADEARSVHGRWAPAASPKSRPTTRISPSCSADRDARRGRASAAGRPRRARRRRADAARPARAGRRQDPDRR